MTDVWFEEGRPLSPAVHLLIPTFRGQRSSPLLLRLDQHAAEALCSATSPCAHCKGSRGLQC